MSGPVEVRVGLPYLLGRPDHAFLTAITQLGASALISTGSLYRPSRGWLAAPLTAWSVRPALDSAGYVAQARFGGYRWSVADYVERVVLNFPGEREGDDAPLRAALPCPWSWWSAPDYCCEPEIAPHRAEVERRIGRTTEAFLEALEALQGWRAEGEVGTPDPLPILQGRTAADYLRSARELAEGIDRVHACTCPTDPGQCTAQWHRARAGLPELVGVGSVCRRELHGPEGLLTLLDALDEALPSHVRLHLFGVKSSAVALLGRFGRRVASVDSAAWDSAARWRALKRGTANDLANRRAALLGWAEAQLHAARAGDLLEAVGRELAARPPAGVTEQEISAFLERRRGMLLRAIADGLRRVA